MNNFTKRLTLLFYHEGEVSAYETFLMNNFGKVFLVNNFEDAKKEYSEHHIDIVMLELNSQHEEKFAYLKYVKEQNLLNLMIILSDNEEFDTISKVVQLGIDGYYKSKLDEKQSYMFEKNVKINPHVLKRKTHLSFQMNQHKQFLYHCLY